MALGLTLWNQPDTLERGAERLTWRCMVGGVPVPPFLDTRNAVVILHFPNFNVYPPKYTKLGSNMAQEPTRPNRKGDLIGWACSGEQGGEPWPVRPSGIGPSMALQEVTFSSCTHILPIWVVVLPVLLVDIIPFNVVLVGVPNKVPRSHAHPIFTKVASLQLWVGWGPPIHVTKEPRHIYLLAREVHPTHQANAILFELDIASL